MKLVFSLDGSESHNIDRNSTVQARTSRLRWEDSALVVTTVVPRVERDGTPEPMEIVQRLRLEAPDDLVIDISQTVGAETLRGSARYRRRQARAFTLSFTEKAHPL